MSGEKTAASILEHIGRFERGATFVAFLVLIAVVFADVASRELIGTGLHWARQAGVYANIFVVMLGIGVASAQGGHLRPRFADHWLPQRWDPLLSRIQEFVMALFCLAFAVVAVSVVAETFQLNERSTVLRIAVWPFQMIIPLVFFLAAAKHALFGLFPRLRPKEATTAADLSASGQV